MRLKVYWLPLAASLAATPALAELPAPTRAMIDAAIATGDAEKVATVLELARTVHPDDVAEIDSIEAEFDAEQEALAAAEADAADEAIREAGLLDNWSGKGELGGFRSSGNSSETGLTAALALTRDGINWRHKLRGRADYQRSNGTTTREQFLAAYEPNYRLNERLYAYALGQYERDRFQGFSARNSVSGGLGYDVFSSDAMNLSVKAGPAWRRTENIGGLTESNIAGLAALDFDWAITNNIKLVEEASAFVQSGNSSLVSLTGLQAAMSSDLSLRLSYTVEHDTNPPPGAVKTDTLSRVTLIYDF